MLFERLGTAWQAFQSRIRAEVRVLVVDDEPSVRTLLADVLEAEGFAVDPDRTLASATRRLAGGGYDLVVVDKNLPDGSGIELVREAARADVPAVLVTAYPSASTVVDALSAGAKDYLAKPFEDVTVAAARLASVVDRRLAERLNARMVRDLSQAVEAGGPDQARVGRVAAQLFAFKRDLGRRPGVLVVEDNPAVAEVVRRILGEANLTAETASDLDAARAWLEHPDGPLTALVSVDIPASLALVRDLKRMDPLLEVVVTSGASDTELALGAIALGASDYVLRPFEGVDVLRARMQRAVARARRGRLRLNLLATLYRAAKEAGDAAAERLLAAMPEAPQQLSPGPVELLPAEDVDLSDLFAEEGEREVEVHPPVQPDVILRPVGPEDQDLPWVEGEPVEEDDRRAHRRVGASLEVRFREVGADDLLYTHLHDISASGLFVHLEHPLPVGTHLSIEILLGWSTDPVRVHGEVVRSVEADPDHPGHTGIGVRLLEGTDDLRRVVDDLARRLVPA